MLHRSRISTPVIYSLRFTARPCKEKKNVYLLKPALLFTVKCNQSWNLHAARGFYPRWNLTVLKRRALTERRMCRSSYHILLVISCSAYKNPHHSCWVCSDTHLIAEFVLRFMLHESGTLWPFFRCMWGQTFTAMWIFCLWVLSNTVHGHIQTQHLAGQWYVYAGSPCVPNHSAARGWLCWAERWGASRGSDETLLCRLRGLPWTLTCCIVFVACAACPHPLPTLVMGTPPALKPGWGSLGPSI